MSDLNDAEEIKVKPKSPFKDKSEFDEEITGFINKYKSTIASHAERMSDYFEMSCFNYIVKFYELQGYDVAVDNLQSKKYRYKCSPAGVQSNFSNFIVGKSIDGKDYIFEIHHNLSVESAHTEGIYTTPDISIIKSGGVMYRSDLYERKMRFSYVDQSNLISFCEVKQFNPFPELLFNFIGTVNELFPLILRDEATTALPIHIAPSLMISGLPNKQARAIRKSIEGRYCINIIYEMFYTATKTFSKKHLHKLRCVGKLPVEAIEHKSNDIDKYFKVAISSADKE